MKDFIAEFEKLLSKIMSYATTMSEDILAFRLLISVNFSARQQQITKATFPVLTYVSLKLQLMNIFDDHTTRDASQLSDIKFESINEVPNLMKKSFMDLMTTRAALGDHREPVTDVVEDTPIAVLNSEVLRLNIADQTYPRNC